MVLRGSTRTILTAPGAIALNTWQYFSVSVTSAGVATLYVNGTQVATSTNTGFVPNTINRTKNYIGKSNWDGHPHFAGRMDHASVWNRALSSGEMASAPTTTYSGAESGLVGYWPLNESAGSIATDRSTGLVIDRSSSGLNATASASVYPQATGFNALNFDKSANSYVTLPSTGFANFTGGFSAGVWAYPTSFTNWERFFDFGNGASSDNIVLYRSGGSNDLLYSVFNGSSATTITAANAIELNKWQYFAVTESANGTTTLYKNGKVLATGTSNIPRNIARANNYIGKSNWADPLFGGQMSDFSVWNRALTQTEINTAMATTFSSNESGLVGYWPMKELSGTTVKDVGSSQLNATAQSGE
jgi:hypothetical protein